MKKLFCWIMSLLLLTTWLNLVHAMDTSDPLVMLNSIANELVDTLKVNKASLKTNPRLVYSLANKVVIPHADLAEMAKRVLPPTVWDGATPQQRVQFKDEFTKLLVRTYASALAEYKDQTIHFYPIRGGYQGKMNVTVNSSISSNDGPAVSVSYKLVLQGTQWKLYDLSVEGVSLLESFRSQFADKLSQGNIADLIAELRRHNQANGG